MIDRPVHPAAAVFPMLPEDDLRELAEDIKANGLLYPVVLDKDGAIVAGRNRYVACGMAGVEPTYADLNGHDPVAYVLSENLQRRHMSAGQRAIAVARVRLLDSNNGSQTQVARLAGVSQGRVAQAELILKHAADLVHGIEAGTESFDKAHEVARARKRDQDDEHDAKERKARADEIELERLRRIAPELAARVPDTMTVDEAKAALALREERARAERESKARVAETVCGWLDPGLRTTSEERAAAIVSTLDAQALATRPDFSAARFARCVETLAAIARRLEAKETSR